LTDAFLSYKVDRYAVVGKRLMSSHETYYPVDTGLARAVLDRGVADISRPLENIVFLELARRGYRIRVGSFKDREVDFTAEREGRTEYYQVCLTMLDDITFDREVRSLKAIDDNYSKTVITLDPVTREMPDGLIHRNVVEWLLDIGK
jgi:predicted AAA+ superfamily ATPase